MQQDAEIKSVRALQAMNWISTPYFPPEIISVTFCSDVILV